MHFCLLRPQESLLRHCERSEAISFLVRGAQRLLHFFRKDEKRYSILKLPSEHFMPFAANPFDVMKGLAKYLRLFRGKIFVIKIGGEVLENPEARKAVAEQLSALWTMSIRLVIVHGGGGEIDALCNRLNLPIQKINGRRVTTPEVLQTVKMTLAGSVHTDWLAELNAAGIPWAILIASIQRCCIHCWSVTMCPYSARFLPGLKVKCSTPMPTPLPLQWQAR